MEENHNQYGAAADPCEPLLANSLYLFQAAEQFPVPIEVSYPDGVSAFVNRAFLKCFHIPEPGLVVGKLNLLKDPYLLSHMNLAESIERLFAGETLTIYDLKVPFREIEARYNPGSRFAAEEIYQDIIGFPIKDAKGSLLFLVIVFLTKQVYRGQDDISKARDYLELNWF